jgi:hypothetical protein
MMECVQEDPSNPQPCSRADMAKYPGGQLAGTGGATAPGASSGGEGTDDTNGGVAPDAGCNPDFEDCTDAGTK